MYSSYELTVAGGRAQAYATQSRSFALYKILVLTGGKDASNVVAMVMKRIIFTHIFLAALKTVNQSLQSLTSCNMKLSIKKSKPVKLF